MAMKPAVSAPSRTSSRPAYSCVRCSDRKVKCDRQNPCSACVKHNVHCVFRPIQPPPKRHKRLKYDILNERLKSYEAIFREQGFDPNQQQDLSVPEHLSGSSRSEVEVPENGVQLPTPASAASDPEYPLTRTQLLHVQGRSKFVDK